MKKSHSNVKNVITLREKGSEDINRASTERNDITQTVPVQKVPTNITRAKKQESTIS